MATVEKATNKLNLRICHCIVAFAAGLLLSGPVSGARTDTDFQLADGDGDSPGIRFIDGDNRELILQKLDSGEATLVNNEGKLCLKPSNDSDDYLCFETLSDLPALFWEGITATNAPGIRVNAGGQLEYRDEDSAAWVPFDDLASGTNLADGSIAEDKLESALVFDDSDALDLSNIDASSRSEGLILPQSTDTSAATAEGQISWDSDNDTLRIGTGSAQVVLGSNDGGLTEVGDAAGPTAFTGANDGNRLVFEGSTDDANEVTVTVADPDSDVTVTIPATSGTLALSSDLATSATETSEGLVELADTAEATAGTDTTRAVTAAGVKAYVDAQDFGSGSGDITTVGDAAGPTAFTGDNDGNQLVFEGSTDDANEVTVTAADPDSDVTVTIPATSGTLALSSELATSATETSEGLVELADTAEATAGTDTTRAVTAAGVKAYVDAQDFGSGSGDITTVGDAAGPTAFTGANDGNQLVFEGGTNDDHEVTVTVADPDSDVTVTIPAATGTLALSSDLASSATETTEGLVELADATEAAAGTDTTRAVTAAGVKAYVDAQGFGSGSGDIATVGDAAGPTAFTGDNDGNQLVFEGSTDDANEVTITVADPDSDVTVTIPAATGTLALSSDLATSATETTEGLVELADATEAAAGTDTTRAVTAAGVKAYVDAQGFGSGSGDITTVGDAAGPTAFTGANDGNQLVFEGSTDDEYEVTIAAADPDSDVTVTIPATSGTLALNSELATSATETSEGLVELADTTEAAAGTDTTRAVTAAGVKAYVDAQDFGIGTGDVTTVGDAAGPTAFTGDNDGNRLVFEGSTDDANEVTVTAADPDSDVTVTIPATSGTLALSSELATSATETSEGLVELADTAEATAGTDTTRAVTAAGVKAYVDAQGFGSGSGDITTVGDAAGPTAFTGDNDGNRLVFEGSTDDANEVTITVADPDSDVTVTIPATSGTLALSSDLATSATETSEGLVELADTAEATAGTDTTRAVTAAGVKAYVDAQDFGSGSGDITTVGDAAGPTAFTGANDGNQLVFEGGTNDDHEVTVTVADPDSDVTVTIPAATGTLALSSDLASSATETTEGLVELADATEAAAGTDTTRAVTAAGVKAYVDAQGFGSGSGDIATVGDAAGPTAFTGDNDGNQLVFEGSTDDANEVTITVADPDSDVTVTIPAATGTLALSSDLATSATETTEGLVELADATEAAAGTDTTRAVTAAGVKAYVDAQGFGSGSGDITTVGDAAGPTAFTGANDGNQLVFEGSTDDEYEVTIAAADPDSDVTVTIPATSGTLALNSELATSATETSEGLVELADTAEATAGTDTTRAVTAAGVKAYVDAQGFGIGAGDITTVGDADGPTAFTGDNDGNQLVFEGGADDDNDLTLQAATTTSAVTVTIPATSGTLALSSDLATSATETSEGLVKLATTTEAAAGTDTTRAVTAAGVKAYVDAQGFSTNSDTLANKTLTSSTLNGADITLNDGDLADMSAINASDTAEGLILPQAADVSAATAEGQISWDTDDDILYVGAGTGTSQTAVASRTYVDDQVSAVSATTLDAAYDTGHTITVDAGAVQLTGSNADDETLEVSNSDNGGALLVENTGTGHTFRVNDEASDTTPFVIDDIGRVGIGTLEPDHHLQIRAVDPVLRLAPNGLWQSSTIQLAGSRNPNGQVLGSIVGHSTGTQDDEAVGAIRFLRADNGTGTGSDLAGEIVFETMSDITSPLTEVMRIDEHGNVGIGTSSPADQLEIEASDTVLSLESDNLSQSSSTIKLAGNAGRGEANLASIIGYNTRDSAKPVVAAIRFLSTGEGTASGEIVFETKRQNDQAQEEAMRIARNGDVGIGTDNPSATLHVEGDTRLTAEADIGSYDACFARIGSGAELGICSSSIRYKENVVDLDIGLELVQRMRPVSFVWKDVADAGLADVGFIAEEVAEVDTRLVMRDVNENNRPVGVKYSHYTAVLTKAVQELSVQLEAVAAENEALEARVVQLEARIGDIEALEARLAALEAK